MGEGGGKNRMSKERDKNLNPVNYFGGVPIYSYEKEG